VLKCLIIAAGKGKRIRKISDSKPLTEIYGIPLIERVILTAHKVGINEFVVVTGYNGSKVRKYIDKVKKTKEIKITHVINNEWDKENGLSVLKARDYLPDKFLLLMGDHLYEENILKNLMAQDIKEDEVILAADFKIDEQHFIDIDDATKVLIEDGYIKDIGKNLEKYNAFDTGAFLCTPAIFEAIEQNKRENNDSSLSGAIKVLAEKKKARAIDIGRSFWIDVDTVEAYEKAKEFLLHKIEKKSDGPISRYLNRPFSRKLTKLFASTNLTPNTISILSFLIAIVSAVLFFFKGYIPLLLGGILAQFSSIIDGCDGEIARLKYLESDFGGWFDAVLDRYADGFLLAGLTWHSYIQNYSAFRLLAGLFAIIGSFVNSYTADKYDSYMKKKTEGHYFRIGRDVRIFIIFLGALFNIPIVALVALALIMNIENLRRIWILWNASKEELKK